jgi:molybdenum cofactor guanylyltransferase
MDRMNETGIAQNDITGLVLAGGRGSRMGGVDKGLVTLNGRLMVEHVVARLQPQVGALLINANRNRERYAALGVPVIADQAGDYLGPLAGMARGLQAASTPYVVTVPCDSPRIALDLVARLATALVDQQADLAVAHDGERTHPVFLLLNRALAGDLNDFLYGGGRKIGLWLARHRVALAHFRDNPDAFVNVNSAEERAALETQLARHGS